MADKQITIQAPKPPSVLDRIRGAMDGWFSPGQPVQPSAPAGTEVRAWDYPVSTNVDFGQNRKGEPIGFKELRALADNTYVLRIIIEKIKDRICAKPWQIKLRSKPGEVKVATLERSSNDSRVKQLTEFFQLPDKEHTWSKWLRMLLEDQIVIDALSLYVQRTRGGEIYRLMPVDGATISRVIDMQGMTPMPPDPAYQQKIKGYPALNLSVAGLIYLPYNPRPGKLFGYSPVEQTVMLCMTAILRTEWQRNSLDESNIPAGFIPFPVGDSGMSTEEAGKFMQYLNSMLKGNLNERSRLFPIPDSSKGVQLIKQEDQHQMFDEWIARCFCYVMGESPQGFVKMMNRATAQQSDDTREETSEQPLLNSVVDLMNLILNSPNYFAQPDLEFEWQTVPSVDLLVQAQVDEIYWTIGKTTVNELRERDGQSPMPNGDVPNDPNAVPPPPDKGPSEQGGPPPPKGSESEPAGKVAKRATLKKKLKISAFTPLPGRASAVKQIEKALTALFKEQAESLPDSLAGAYGRLTKATNPDPQIDTIMLEVSFADWASIVPTVEPALSSIGEAANGWVFAQLDTDLTSDPFDRVNEQAVAYAKDRAAAMVGMKWDGGELVANPDARWAITDTTRENLRELVTQAFADGMSPAQLAVAIRDSETFSAARAKMIAQTEVGMAQMDANIHSAMTLGMAEKSVLTSNEGPCIICAAFAELGRVAMNYEYEPGVLGPLFHPNCRCDMATWKKRKAA